MYIFYAFQCEILHKTTSLKVVLGPNKVRNIKNFNFCFYFCLKYVSLHVFDLSFLKKYKNVF